MCVCVFVFIHTATIGREEVDRNEIEPRVKIWEDKGNKKEDEEDLEGDFLGGRALNTLSPGYKSDSD